MCDLIFWGMIELELSFRSHLFLGSSDEDDTSQDDSDDDFDLMELDDDTNEALLDNFMASTAQAGKTRGVDPKLLSKIWRISHEDAQRTIDVTTQTSTGTDDPTLSKNYSTNDRMIRYKRSKDFFFMDTFFATKKGGQSSCDRILTYDTLLDVLW